jgi:hypothetical protein
VENISRKHKLKAKAESGMQKVEIGKWKVKKRKAESRRGKWKRKAEAESGS